MSYPPPPPPSSYPSPPGSGSPPAGTAAPVRLRGRGLRLTGWILLGVGAALLVAGVVVLATKSFAAVNDFQRISFAQGSGTVNLDGTGKWVGYYEASNVDSSIDRVPNFRVAVTDPNGQPISLHPYGQRSDGKIEKFTYQYNDHNGAAAFEFTVTTPGNYQVELAPGETLPAGADVAIGRDISGKTTAGAILVVIGVGLGIVAVILLIIGYVKRSNHKGELRGAPAYWGGPGPAYGAPSPAYQPPPPGYQPPPPGYQPPPPGYQPPPSGYQPPASQPPNFGEEPPPS